jgi:hypothetical protein
MPFLQFSITGAESVEFRHAPGDNVRSVVDPSVSRGL